MYQHSKDVTFRNVESFIKLKIIDIGGKAS